MKLQKLPPTSLYEQHQSEKHLNVSASESLRFFEVGFKATAEIIIFPNNTGFIHVFLLINGVIVDCI